MLDDRVAVFELLLARPTCNNLATGKLQVLVLACVVLVEPSTCMKPVDKEVLGGIRLTLGGNLLWLLNDQHSF